MFITKKHLSRRAFLQGSGTMLALPLLESMVPAQTPKPIQEQLTAWFNQVTSSEEAKKFLNNFASDPWVATPEEAQAILRKEVADWGEYMRIAKMEPQG